MLPVALSLEFVPTEHLNHFWRTIFSHRITEGWCTCEVVVCVWDQINYSAHVYYHKLFKVHYVVLEKELKQRIVILTTLIKS